MRVVTYLDGGDPQLFFKAERRAVASVLDGVIPDGSSAPCRRHKGPISEDSWSNFVVKRSIAQAARLAEKGRARSG
jgi:hypothetical protein